MRLLSVTAALLAATACGSSAGGVAVRQPACTVTSPLAPLPAGLAETSGAAAGPDGSGLVWTHNDSGGETAVFAVSPDGRLVATIPLTGAENVDWEDMAAGPCPGGRCLFLADVGDNEAKRDEVALYRIAEPDPARPAPAVAERFRIRYPGGPRDTESVFVLGGDVYLLTKARNSPLELYRYPGALRGEALVGLELVASFSDDRLHLSGQVTGADASPDGRRIAVRTYRALQLYPAAAFLRGDTAGVRTLDLAPLGEPQGEGVAWLDSTRVVLTSEGVGEDAPGTIAVLTCPA